MKISPKQKFTKKARLNVKFAFNKLTICSKYISNYFSPITLLVPVIVNHDKVSRANVYRQILIHVKNTDYRVYFKRLVLES